jgi:hypothetical protein
MSSIPASNPVKSVSHALHNMEIGSFVRIQGWCAREDIYEGASGYYVWLEDHDNDSDDHIRVQVSQYVVKQYHELFDTLIDYSKSDPELIEYYESQKPSEIVDRQLSVIKSRHSRFERDGIVTLNLVICGVIHDHFNPDKNGLNGPADMGSKTRKGQYNWIRNAHVFDDQFFFSMFPELEDTKDTDSFSIDIEEVD